MILGPSKKMVQDAYDKSEMTKVSKADYEERQMIYARLKAIEVSLPIADRKKLRKNGCV